MFISTIGFLFILFINIAFDMLSKKTSQCYTTSPKPIKIVCLLLLHHIINVFVNFGWLLYSPILLVLYIISIPVMYVHWYLNNNTCKVTTQMNNMCGWSENTYFNDIFNILGFKKYENWDKIYHNVFIGIGISIAIYKLINR
jgi:hypothetical protein